jgi:hypothetical protein
MAVCERVTKILSPVKSRIIGSLEGNHEATWRLRGRGHVAQWMADQLGVPMLGYSMLGEITFEAGKHRRKISLHATHGSGCAITTGAKVNRLERAMVAFPFTDLVLVGHMHIAIENIASRLSLQGGRICEHVQTGIITGSYLRTYPEGASGYSERGGFPPTVIGHRAIEIIPSRGVVGSRRAT